MKFLKAALSITIILLLVNSLIYFDNHITYFANYAHDTYLAVLILGAILFFIVFVFKIRRNNKFVFRADDELSSKRKYKGGYYAFFYTLLLWFYLFNSRSQFTDISNLLGGGIILSLLIGVVTILVSNYNLHEKQD